MSRRLLRCVIAVVCGGHTLIGNQVVLAADIPWKLDEPTALRLLTEAYGHGVDPSRFDFDPGMSQRFFEFDGLNRSPANGSFGFFAVNPWTGDVWALWGCHKLSTPALRKSKAAIRRQFTHSEAKEYLRLARLKPDCVVEIPKKGQ